MILPKEAPHKEKLHSYYLKFENFVAAMQEEIGSGCIYCRSPRQAHMIYFNADTLGRCVVEDRDQPPRIYHQLGDAIDAFKVLPFIISVYYLDDDAVDFWGRLPPCKKEKRAITNTGRLSLEIIVANYIADRFSGFFDITAETGKGGLLFFQKGSMIGGSYTWGRGGLSPGVKDYRKLAGLFASERCTLDIGAFILP